LKALDHPLTRLVAVLLCSAGLAACSSTTPTATTTTASSGNHITVNLVHEPAGTATLSWNSSTGKVTATVDITDLTPGSSHAVHIHSGSCLNQGPVVVAFPDITANPAGVFSGTITSVNSTSKGLNSKEYFNVHLGDSAQLGTALGFTPISCGDLPASTTQSAASVTLAALPQAGQHPTATATIDYSPADHTLTVDVVASGLVPNSVHATHIHLGSCQNEGAVLYGLNATDANAQGDANVRTVVNNVMSPPPSNGWYINLHLGAPNQILSSGNKPTLYFEPILCANIP
jgi:hypothetical protein